PEWSVSIGYVVDGEAVAGGILNPSTDRRVVGAVGSGVTVNGTPSRVSDRATLAGASVLASRSEIGRGEWARFEDLGVVPCGSVAWKMALVAAGDVDATWTLVPKNEWDVAAGTALVRAGGGAVFYPSGEPPRFNRSRTKLEGLVACSAVLEAEIRARLRIPENA
ncbi:MAG: 3'(2'),5'-bisphosphate nucleotidase CysQ, partial [Planctomycetota bacterium]|nr:3'(2'),5'-bisphosphate nucleotidase CysQ [Planctomycetota bacterium]